jgi:hypothetical protein
MVDKEIKAGVEKDTPKSAGVSTPKVEKNTISVDADTLKALIKQNEDFKLAISDLQKNAVAQNPNQSAFNNPTLMKTGKKETLLKMRKWNDKYFIGFENVGKPNKPLYIYNEYNPQTRENVQFCNIILDGEKAPLKLEYVEFLRESERVLVKMKRKIELEDKVTTQGYVQKKDFADNGYGMFETMVQVPVDVIEKQYAFEVELEDGRVLEISQECIG